MVNSPLSGVMTGGIALITIADGMLVTSLTVRPSRVATQLTSEPVSVTYTGDVTTSVSAVGSEPSRVQRSSAPVVAEVTLMSASAVKSPSIGSSTGAYALTV